jgi:hypothetical protein
VTDLDNLVLLCRRHHRFVHELGYRVDEKLRFFDPWGLEIRPVPKPPHGDADALIRHDEDVAPTTCAGGYAGSIDIDLAVDALLAATGQSARA